MLGVESFERKFNLYLLDEGEIYIKEFVADVQEANDLKRQGVIVVGSRSLIFEPDNRREPIVKYMFRNFLDKPTLVNFLSKEEILPDIIQVTLDRKVLIYSNIKPYETITQDIKLSMNFLYEKNIYPLVMTLFERFTNKRGFEFDSIDILDKLYTFEFDLTQLESISESCLLKKEMRVCKIMPLIEVPGVLMMTDERIYFQPIYIVNSNKSYSIKYSEFIHLFKRRIKHREIGIEVIAKGNNNLFIEFGCSGDRDLIYSMLSSLVPKESLEEIALEKYTKMWTIGEISNYEYLMVLNSAANRTRNDLSQYPVFPWVLTNYNDNSIDLNDESNYRDLSLPIGKLNDKRFKSYKERYIDMPDPKYLYGTHYSTPAYVIGYLIRKYPQYMIKLQAGKFDHAARLFSSIEIDWNVKSLLKNRYALQTQGALRS